MTGLFELHLLIDPTCILRCKLFEGIQIGIRRLIDIVGIRQIAVIFQVGADLGAQVDQIVTGIAGRSMRPWFFRLPSASLLGQ